jgi:hypothetical protein
VSICPVDSFEGSPELLTVFVAVGGNEYDCSTGNRLTVIIRMSDEIVFSPFCGLYDFAEPVVD